MPTLTPDQPTTSPVPDAARPPAPRGSGIDPATVRGALLIAVVGAILGGLVVWALIELPQHLAVHWH